ncbi:UDP-galactopyranose mutase [Mytilus galloprovincialis]|uniref:UDP-galactopyranose mutase n=1 Tax=Mytilus galloprovincialis TaxID=29158 RepID=A0A8B6E9R4_MYTGA|nr:UDP-galactopyranose mutase [Mytilus galloprovincialis]
MSTDYLVVGCGLSGAVMARFMAEERNKKVLIVDKRDHMGGNCYDYIDENGIRINKYGVHLFHTNSERVWKYVNRFSSWTRWEHKVLGVIDGQYIPLPPNITTINMLCGQHLTNQQEADDWLSRNQLKHEHIDNGYQMATSRVGETLYEKIFMHYTFKQWGRYPEELDASVLARIPVRNNFDDRYFSDKYQALPTDGYTKVFKNILDHENITIRLSCDCFDINPSAVSNSTIIYSGPIEDFFTNVGYPKLEYRSVNFEIQRLKNIKFFQPCAAVNHPGPETAFTRIIEYKHLLNQDSPHTTIISETTCSDGDPYYPVPNKRNMELYEQYKALTEKERNINFVGRLASYKCFNMDQSILNALEYCDSNFSI